MKPSLIFNNRKLEFNWVFYFPSCLSTLFFLWLHARDQHKLSTVYVGCFQQHEAVGGFLSTLKLRKCVNFGEKNQNIFPINSFYAFMRRFENAIFCQILQSAMDKTHFVSGGHITLTRRANHRFTNWLVMMLVGDNLPVMLHNHCFKTTFLQLNLQSELFRAGPDVPAPIGILSGERCGSCNRVESNIVFYTAEICPGNWPFVVVTCLFLNWNHVISERVH